MSWTKRQFIEAAFEEIGYAAYTYDLQPQQLETALNRLDAMVATWNTIGIRLGYPLPSEPGAAGLDEVTDVPDSANEAIYSNLAIRIAPTVGKAVSAETKRTANTSYKALLTLHTRPPEKQLPAGVPLGAGNKPWRNGGQREFTPEPEEQITTGGDGALELN